MEGSVINDFRNAMTNEGLIFDGEIIADGCLHRMHIHGDKTLSLNGWYVLHLDSIPIGIFGCWKRDIYKTWYAKHSQLVSIDEKNDLNRRLNELQLKQEKEKALVHEKTKHRAENIWHKSLVAGDTHSYLLAKRVKNYGLRCYRGALVLPLYDSEEVLHNLQFISSTEKNYQKRFLLGGRKKGLFYLIGQFTNQLYIAEGYATGATVHEATGCGVIVAFDCGNLLSVAKAIHKKYPNYELIFAADNDLHTSNNPGLTKAKEAAELVGGKVIAPTFVNMDGNPTDWNDLLLQEGIDIVQKQLLTTQTGRKEETAKKTVSEKVIELLLDVEFFHDEHRSAYATIRHKGHDETWPIESGFFKDFLSKRYWESYKQLLNKNSLSELISLMKGKAIFDGNCQKVFTRVGLFNNCIYIYLANDRREVVEVSATGWKILAHAPIKFCVTSAMTTLPTPNNGGKIDELWTFINIPPKSRKLVLAWILECFRINTHFPILVLSGMQGSAKSTTQHILRSFIDPSVSNLRGAPKKSEDLLINARNNWLVSFNNLSNLTAQQQDDLCCLSTGGGFSTRKLYTTTEEELVDIKRPVILNGINDLVTQQDLIDRCLVVDLPPITEQKRKTDQELLTQLDESSARIFGALLSVLSNALAKLPYVDLAEKPRLADYALLGVAIERALGWESGSFMSDYRQACSESITAAMEHSPVAVALLEFVETKGSYSGSYGVLYKELTQRFKSDMAGWPKSAKGLSNQIKRQIPALKTVGIEVVFDPLRKKDGYHLKIMKGENIVHQVHCMSSASTGLVPSDECVDEGEHVKASYPHQLHRQNPYLVKQDECGEHNELVKQRIIDSDREEYRI